MTDRSGPNFTLNLHPDTVARALAGRIQPPCGPREPRVCHYGDGRAAPRIAALVTRLSVRERLLVKGFATEDLRFTAPWRGTPGTAHADAAA